MLTLSNKISPLQHLSTLNNPLKLQNFKLLFDKLSTVGFLVRIYVRIWESYDTRIEMNCIYLRFRICRTEGTHLSEVSGVWLQAPLSCRLPGLQEPGSRARERAAVHAEARGHLKGATPLFVYHSLYAASLFPPACVDPVLCGPLPVIGDLLTFARGLITVNCAPLHYALRTSRPALTHIESSSLHRFLHSVFPLSIEIVDVRLIILFIY